MILAFSASYVPLFFLYTTLVWGIPVLFVFKNFERYRNNGIGIKTTAFFAFLSGLISIQCGDFFYYTLMLQGFNVSDHLEPFYHWLWEVTHSYLLWRTVIWGLATFSFFWMVKRIPVNKYFACFIFIIAQLFFWGNMRNMLGFTTLFLGISFMFYPLKHIPRTISMAVGALLVLLCLNLHRSMYLYAIVMILAFIPWGKNVFRLSVIVFPFLYTSVFIFASFFLLNFGDAEFQELGKRYVKAGQIEGTLLQKINTLILTISYGYLVLKCFRYNSIYRVPAFFRVMLRYSYMLFYAGLLFYGQENAEWVSLRFLNAGELGLTVCFMYFLYKLPQTNSIRLALLGIFWISLFNWMYLFYGWKNTVQNIMNYGNFILS